MTLKECIALSILLIIQWSPGYDLEVLWKGQLVFFVLPEKMCAPMMTSFRSLNTIFFHIDNQKEILID